MRGVVILAGAVLLASVAHTAEGTVGKSKEEVVKRTALEAGEAWNTHRVEAIAPYFTLDCDYVSFDGRPLKGRAEMEKGYAASHATFLKAAHMTSEILAVRFIKADVAIVDVSWAMEGAAGPNGQAFPAMKGLLTQVLVKQQGKWLISAQRMMVPLNFKQEGK